MKQNWDQYCRKLSWDSIVTASLMLLIFSKMVFFRGGILQNIKIKFLEGFSAAAKKITPLSQMLIFCGWKMNGQSVSLLEGQEKSEGKERKGKKGESYKQGGQNYPRLILHDTSKFVFPNTLYPIK